MEITVQDAPIMAEWIVDSIGDADSEIAMLTKEVQELRESLLKTAYELELAISRRERLESDLAAITKEEEE